MWCSFSELDASISLLLFQLLIRIFELFFRRRNDGYIRADSYLRFNGNVERATLGEVKTTIARRTKQIFRTKNSTKISFDIKSIYKEFSIFLYLEINLHNWNVSTRYVGEIQINVLTNIFSKFKARLKTSRPLFGHTKVDSIVSILKWIRQTSGYFIF